MNSVSTKAILLLEDGMYFEGKAAGKIGTTSGEICFNTGMTGYQEIFTDPSYFGQILVCTHVHIGNYGIHTDETESANVKISGLVCKNFNVSYSRKSAETNIESYFIQQNTVGISDIDTRALVRHIREKGAMNAIISSEITDIATLKELLLKTPDMAGLELSSKVTTPSAYEVGNPNSKYKVALLDLGAKSNIIRSLNKRDCLVKVFPAQTPYTEMKAWKPDGYLISNGPGDPSAMKYAVETVSEILNADERIFGICLGHQILAESCGISTYKMHHGHRGINHPVINLKTGKCEITSQNHGFSISEEDLKNNSSVEITHLNLNDRTIEGIRIKNKPAFSVQFHPEASPGPHDSSYLFDEFVNTFRI